nr:hypothetical protein [Tanacetum cinerariifolium]
MPAKAKKDVPLTKKPTTKPKPTMKKAPVKADRGKGLNVLLKVALSKAAQLKKVTKRSKKDFYISHVNGSDEGTGTKLGVPDVSKYDFKSKKESWGDGREEDDDDDEYYTEDESDNDGNDDDGDNDSNDGDGDNDGNYDDGDNDDGDDEYSDEFTNEEDDDDNAKEETEEELVEELYRDVEEDAHVTLTTVHDTQKTKGLMQSSFVLSKFKNKLLNFENASPNDNEIASLMDTTVHHEEPSSQTSFLFTVPVMDPLSQQATPTPTPTALEVTTLFPALPDFSSVFRFNDRVTNLERDLSEMKQVNHYAQAIS